MTHDEKTEHARQALRKRLTPLQYAVTQEGATEPPFENAYFDERRAGLYVDVVDGAPLFVSADKFDSGCGWPSFARPVVPSALARRVDFRGGMLRMEVLSASSGSHLGHVFADGPAESGGLRYCMNSAALRFVPEEDMTLEGYGAFLGLLRRAKAKP